MWGGPETATLWNTKTLANRVQEKRKEYFIKTSMKHLELIRFSKQILLRKFITQ